MPGNAIQELQRGPRVTLYRLPSKPDAPRVLLKVLEGAEADEAAAEQLAHEYAIAQRLHTPAAVKVHQLTTHEGRPALVLEDFGGESLDRQLGRPMSAEEFLPLALRIAQAVAEVHALGVVHKDIKPSNIIVGDGTVKLTDFGIATFAAAEQQVVARTGAMDGTVAYMSPEQTGRMNRGVDFRSDLYSLGVTFYEMLTGRLPFIAHDTLGWVHSHIAKQPPEPRSIVGSIPVALSDITMRLLAKDVEERYQTASGLVEDLRWCLSEWERAKDVGPFPLGRNDLSDRFQLPQKLYGRAEAVATLLDAFERTIVEAAPRVVLIRGFSGIGKSSLVQELYRPIVRTRGRFIGGKFDLSKRHTPYSAVAAAVSDVVHQLLTYEEQELGLWRQKLQGALGSSGAVITQVAPELERLLGPQPAVPQLPASEAQNRFNIAFQSFVAAMATPDHPLVVFLDDMQWADAATLSLLQTALASGGTGPVLYVLAYRDNEVHAGHPFAACMESLKKNGVGILELQVPPLTEENVRQLVCDTLHASPDDCEELSRLVHARTAGNPFFVNEFLRALHREKIIEFSSAGQRWTWDPTKIENQGITDNVVELMIVRVRRLPDAAQRSLELAACIGGTFALQTLAIVTEHSPEETLAALEPALEIGIIVPLTDEPASAGRKFRFQHDHIQQAAYALIEEHERPRVHLQIGRLMLRALQGVERETCLFEIVNQLNMGLPLIEADEDREELLELNLRAARRAKTSTAYGAARGYFTVAASLLPQNDWAIDHRRAFALHLELAETEYLTGELAAADGRFTMLIDRADSLLERGAVWSMQMRLYQVAGDYDRATRTALESFAEFGLAVPATDEEAAVAVAEEAARAVALRAGRPVGELASAPRMADPNAVMLMGLLEASGPPLYIVRPALFPWIALVMVNLSLEQGHSEASCYGYGIYAILLCAAFGDVESGYAFSQLAIALNEEFEDVKLRGCMLHLLGDHVNFWKNPIASDLPILEKGFAACVEGGDLIYSNYIGFQAPWHALESGQPLDDVMALTTRYAAFARQTKHEPVLQTIRLEQQFIRSLQGKTKSRDSFDDDDFTEAAAAADLATAQFGCGIVYRQIMKLISSYMYGDDEAAWEWAESAKPNLAAAFSMPMEVSYHLYRSLTAARRLRQAEKTASSALLEELAQTENKFELWARTCPQNFGHKHALVAAEHARVKGDIAGAIREYERAIGEARQHGLVHYEALGSELAADFYHSLGAGSAYELHLRRALSLYARWGASEKVRALEGRHAALAGLRSASFVPSTTSGYRSHELDMLSVVRMSQTISGEMEFSALVETLIRIVVEAAGADRGILLLAENETLVVAAQHDLNRAVEIGPSEGLAGVRLPTSLINYVRRTGQRVHLEDANIRNEFSDDGYLREAKPRSVLCLPVARGCVLQGLFYLENTLVAGAFSRDRIGVLELLAAQVAISIDNSRLYKSAQEAVRVRDDFLSIASHELKTPLTPLQLQLQTLQRGLSGQGDQFSAARALAKLDVIGRQVDRLEKLVDSLLDIARITGKRLEIQHEDVDLSEVVRDVVSRCAEEEKRTGCSFDLDIPERLVGRWDRLRLDQIITNLVSNALKFGAGKPIRIQVDCDGDRSRLTVGDEGIGISAEDQARIFQRFERAVTSRHYGGFGLGLWIVKQIVEGLGGTIEVASETGKGSIFTVELPLNPAPDDPSP